MVSGFNLTNDLTITPPAGMELRTSGSYTSSALAITPAAGTVSNTTVFLRIAAATPATNSFSGNVTVASSGATNKTLAVSGTVLPDTTPFVSASTPSLSAFSATAGSVSTHQSFTATAKNLTNAFTVTAPGGFQVSTNGVDFSDSLTLAQTNGLSTNTISVRVAGTNSASSPAGNVILASSGATSANVAVSATVTNATLTVSLNPALMPENSTSTGTVSVPTPRIADLTINLSSGTASAATVPTSVLLAAGQTSVNFTATGVPDPGYAERSSVITASATNCNNGTATLTVLNADPAPIRPIALSGSGTNNTVTQDFNGLGTNAVTGVIPASNGVIVSLGDLTSSSLNGWYAAKNSGTGTGATSISTNTNSSTGTLYNFGASGSSERALGAIATGTTATTFGALFTNSSVGTITNVRISVKGEFWRSSTSTSNVLTFGYGAVDGSNVTTSNFLTASNGVGTVAGLNIVGPAPVLTNNALDGTSAANQTNLTAVSVPLVLLAGQTGFIRWQDVNDAGDDAGLAIDDFSLTYDVDTSLGLSSFSPGSGAVETTVTISGANFTNGIPVRFNGVTATEVTVSNSTTLTAKVPAGATTGYLSVGSGAGAVTNNSLAFVVGSFQAGFLNGLSRDLTNAFGSVTIGSEKATNLITIGGGLPGTNLVALLDSPDFQVATANVDVGAPSAFASTAEIAAPGGEVDSDVSDYFVFRFFPSTSGSKTATATLTSGGLPVARLTLTGTATGLAQPSFVYGFGQSGQAVLAWSNSASFSDLVLLGREGSSPASPGASESFTGASSNFPFATLASNGASVLFTGDSTTTNLTVTGLTNNRFYHFKLFNRQGGFVSSGAYLRVMPYADLSNRITQWNFNNSDLTPNVGAGTATAVGGVTPSFQNGVSGSSDRALTNRSVSVKGVSGQFTGLQFAASTAGKKDIKAYWDLNASGTAAKHTRFQYTLDVTAATPSWVDYSPGTADSPGVAPEGGLYAVDGADATLLQRSADLTGISGVENNANFAFRVITANAPGTNVIARADGTSAAYSTTGTVKYDMVTLTGVDGNFSPVISGPTTLSGTVGVAITPVTVTASGSPTSYGATGLPAGLQINPVTGVISGTPEAVGSSVIVQLSAANNGGTGTANLIVNIAKGTPTISVLPTASPITAGQALSSSTISGGTVNPAGGNWAWSVPATVVTAGTNSYAAVYTPASADQAHWNSLTNNVTVVVNPAAPAGSSFSGWLGTNSPSAAMLMQYAYGAASPSNAVSRSNLPSGGIVGTNLTLTYFVRQEATNPNLVAPQWHTNLAESNAWAAVDSNNITSLGTNTVDGVQVIQKRASVPVEGSRKFLRLKISE